VRIDEKSKGFRVYWPKKHTVTVEQNVYFNKQEVLLDHLRGEDYEIIEAPIATHDVSSISTQGQPNHTQPNHTDEASVSIGPRIPTPETLDPNNIPCKRCTRKPSQQVQDLIDG